MNNHESGNRYCYLLDSVYFDRSYPIPQRSFLKQIQLSLHWLKSYLGLQSADQTCQGY